MAQSPFPHQLTRLQVPAGPACSVERWTLRAAICRLLLPALCCLLLTGCAGFRPSSVTMARARTSKFSLQHRTRIASLDDRDSLLAAAPFRWQVAARTQAGLPLQMITSGRSGFRSMVIGSIGGHDPAGIRLTEDLARYVHHNQSIMGGIRTSILRTLNPDGLRDRHYRNESGIYLNNEFPTDGRIPRRQILEQLPAEMRFLLAVIDHQRPQRIIHVRSIRDTRGMIAASSGGMDSAREAADWLGFRLKSLPKSVKPRTLEYWASHREDCDVITLGIPETSDDAAVWSLYGDVLLGLLLDGDSRGRQMVREEQLRRRSARHRRPRNNRQSLGDMFRDDTAFDSSLLPFE